MGSKTKSSPIVWRRYFVVALTQLVCVLVLSLSADVQAAPPWPEACAEGSLPSNDPQFPADQLILICIPQNWNGQLLVYAHAYVPPQAPLALPVQELTLPEGQTLPEILLAQGFAFATSSYHKNGYAVKQARNDLNALVEHFKTVVPPGSLQRVFVAGASEGGLIATMLVERFPHKYDGGLALCAPIAGARYQISYLNDFRVVFDYFFPDVFSFGVADVPPDAFQDWEAVYVPAITAAILSDVELGRGATDQLFQVTDAARDPLDPTNSAVTATVGILFYSIFGSNDLIEVADGMPYGNQNERYHGSDDNAALNAGVERVKSDQTARRYVRQFYQTTGRLRRPLVTLHTTLDEIVPFKHELFYRRMVSHTHHRDLLTILPVQRYGHCNFTTEEILGAFALLVRKSTAQVSSEEQVNSDLKIYLPLIFTP